MSQLTLGPTAPVRPTLRSRALLHVIAGTVTLTVLLLLARPWLPPAWSTPGSPELYLTGVFGSLALLAPYAFSLGKRTGLSRSPPAWFIAHVLLACVGAAALVIHSALHLTRPPALLLAVLAVLIVQGAWARVILPRQISATFASRPAAFAPAGAGARRPDRVALRQLIDRKTELLGRLDPLASEATFSPRPGHWLRKPRLTWRYARLAADEIALMDTRGALPVRQRYWRALHMALAAALLLGLLVHVVTVTFFAGYVADGAPVHWWHLAAWGAR